MEWRETKVGDSTVRWRLRLREEFQLETEEGWTLALGLATGRRGDPRDPDWLFGDRDGQLLIRPSPAWVRWRPQRRDMPSLTAGRMPMPLLRVNDLIFDGDWHPLGASLESQLGEATSLLRSHAGTFWLADMGAPSWRLHTGQIAWDRAPSRDWRTLVGASVVWHVDAEERSPPIAPPHAVGNTLRSDLPGDPSRLATDFHLIEGFALVTWDPWLPVSMCAQGVVNTAASAERTGWLIGVSAGAARAVRGVEAGWSYRELRADAVPASLADSDFGGTALHAHRIHIRWQPLRNLWLTLAWRSTRPLSSRGPPPTELWQADLLLRF
ncbi:MAG: putative porin [Kiritimatiellae bacterium]|nr:putative porin [Kiritimatiellia bacterium]